MPIQRCKKNGKPGWKWGKSGTCYTGSGAKSKARRQMRAIYSSGYIGNLEQLDDRLQNGSGESGISDEEERGCCGCPGDADNGSPGTNQRVKGSRRQDLAETEQSHSSTTSKSDAIASRDKGRKNGSPSSAEKRGNTASLRIDPTKTITLRRQFLSEFRSRLNLLKKDIRNLVKEEDVFGLKRSKVFNQDSGKFSGVIVNTRFSLLSTSKQIEEFRRWIDNRAEFHLIGDERNPWWDKYVKEVYRKGAGGIFDEVARKSSSLTTNQESGDDRKVAKLAFLSLLLRKSRILEKIKILSSRIFSRVRGIKDSIVKRLTGDVTDGLESGKTISQMSKSMIDSVDSEIKNANRLVQTEITRSYASGQLAALGDLEVENVRILAEWRTMRDKFVCPICRPNEGRILTIAEAEGMIPAHEFCRCRYVPILDRNE